MLIQFFIQTVLYYQFWKRYYFQKTFMKWYVHTDSSSSKKTLCYRVFENFTQTFYLILSAIISILRKL
jgi:hypothetical protein